MEHKDGVSYRTMSSVTASTTSNFISP